MRRALALWLLLFGVYAATLGLDGHNGHESAYLVAAKTLADDGSTDASDDGLGFPLLILPAYEIGGGDAVELFLAAVAALALALAYRLALRAAPDPWALGATAAVGLSPPLLAYSTTIYPELSVGAALTGAALFALKIDDRPGWRPAFGCFLLLGAVPWLGVRFVPAGVVIGVLAARALWRSRRRTLAVGSVELALFSVAFCVGINEALYDNPTPYPTAEAATGANNASDYVERVPRLATLFGDPGFGVLRWAPILVLAFVGLWWLWRSRRDHLARAVSALHATELTVGLCAAVLAVQLGVAVLLAPHTEGEWFPARHLVPALPLAVPLVAVGLRRLPRVGVALAVVTLALSAWLYVDVRWGDGELRAASHQSSSRATNTLGLSA
jgi:hypothetical protein